jgi:Probable cobalt transporter subunit (CbtA)
MAIFRSIMFSAVLAGVIVGLTVTVLQQFGTVPLILKSEVYEKAAESKAASHLDASSVNHHDSANSHDHAQSTWEPSDGFERNAYTVLFNVVVWFRAASCRRARPVPPSHNVARGLAVGSRRICDLRSRPDARVAAGVARRSGRATWAASDLVGRHGGLDSGWSRARRLQPLTSRRNGWDRLDGGPAPRRSAAT